MAEREGKVEKIKTIVFITVIGIFMTGINLLHADWDHVTGDFPKQVDATQAGTGKLGVLLAVYIEPPDWIHPHDYRSEALNEWISQLEDMLPVPVETGFSGESFPPPLARFGMGIKPPWQTIEQAVHKLEDKGVTEIIAYQIIACPGTPAMLQVYEDIEESTDKTPIYCTANSFGDAPETVESIINRGLTLGEDNEIDPKDATLIITMCCGSMGFGDTEPHYALGESLVNQIENRGKFKEVNFTILVDLFPYIREAKGCLLVVPQFTTSSLILDIKHKLFLIGKNYRYDGEVITDTPDSINWVMNQFYDYPNNIVWANHVALEENE